MDKLIMKELKDINILSSKNVLDFRKYISIKYAKATSKEKADILADAIRKTIDERIPKVEKSLKTNLIDNIIKTSLHQGSFDINSEDIFIECLNLKCNINEDIFLSALCGWINEVTEKSIDEENMKKFINSVYSLEVKAYNAESISTVLVEAIQDKYDYSSENDISDNDISDDINQDILTPIESVYLNNRSEVGLVIDKLIFLKNKMKCFRLKDIAIAMLLIMLVFSIKIFGVNYISGSNANNTIKDEHSIAQEIPSLTVSDTQNQVDSNNSSGWEKLIMEATAYDLSIECCGKARNHPLYGITASGTKATIGRTVAVDTSIIPLGSRLYIKFPEEYSNLDGIYFAEDTGSKVKGNIIDIFLGEDKIGESIIHKKADNFGRRRVEVSLIKSESSISSRPIDKIISEKFE